MVVAFAEPEGLAAAEKELAELTQSLQPGALVVLQGLSKRPELNGSSAQVVRWDAHKDRWLCRTERDGVTVQVEAELRNLALVKLKKAVEGPANFSPWRIDVNAKRKVPGQRGGGRSTSSAPADGAPRWRCPLVQQLMTADNTSPVGRIVSRWARQAEDFATGHVREAFAGLWSKLHGAAASGESAKKIVTVVLALAGADTADHEATMQQAEELARTALTDPCVARVGPDDFRSLPLAVRRICFQLTSDGGRIGAEAYPEEEEDEDAEPLRQGSCTGGALDFVDWRRERGLTGPLVLMISQADAVPKDTMRDVISCWAAACGDNDIPMLVLLGLQQPPQGRFDLLESDPLGNMRLASVGCLFDAGAVCNQLLEHIVADPSCPMALDPKLLQKLRDLFLYTRHSVSYVMKTLALLCERALSQSQLAAVLCPPLDETGERPSPWELEKAFSARLTKAKSPGLFERLRELRVPEDRGCSDDELKKWAAEAAAKAMLWRRGIMDSFGAWDVLLCATHPMQRHDVRARRLCKLLQALWPQAHAVPGSNVDPVEAEQRLMTGLLGSCLTLLDTEVTARAHLDKLLQDLLSADLPLDPDFQAELESMTGPDVPDAKICNGLRDWFYRLRAASWQPLTGAPRELFLQGFSCASDLVHKVEQQLNGSGSGLSEALLLPLARGRGDGLPDDAALLFRLTESCSGRSVAVADLWECFSARARPAAGGDGAVLKRRFGQALLMLHSLGMYVPRQGTRAQTESGPPVSGWKVVKRRFGRLTQPPVDAAKPQHAAAASPPHLHEQKASWSSPAPPALAGERETAPGTQAGGGEVGVNDSPATSAFRVVAAGSPTASPRASPPRGVTPEHRARLEQQRAHLAASAAKRRDSEASSWGESKDSSQMVKNPGKRARIFM